MYFKSITDAVEYVVSNGITAFTCRRQDAGEHIGEYKLTAFEDINRKIER